MKMPSIPDPRGEFTRLAPSHYRIMARKAQGFTEQQIANEFDISRKTVSSYAERARDRLGCESNQQVLWMFYAAHAPGIWDLPDTAPGIDPLA